ncbi:MAG: RNA methyltransferase, partial [Oscillospiraceae bacterium]|nr:RNA methyltransferase [Oscillospiraceae bacterium]
MPSVIAIQNFEDPRLDLYARLSEAQLLNREHPEEGVFIAESPKVIHRALDAGCVPLSVLVEDRHVEGEARDVLARCGDIPVFTAPFDLLTQLTGFKLTRGLLCAMRRPAPLSVEDVCRNARRVAVLENVMNPTNIGAIFRSAAALNMDAVLLTPGCSDPLYRRAIRVSMGTVFQVPWAWLEDDIIRLMDLGFKTAAMALSEDSVSIKDERLLAEEKLAIVLGTEGDGLAEATIAHCDY